MSERYHIILRSASGAKSSLPPLAVRMRRVPTLEALDERHWCFGEADAHGRLELEFCGGAGDEFETVDFSIPRPWVPSRGPQVFALVFMLRDWLGMQAYDPQIDSLLDKEVVLKGLVAMRQAQRDHEAAKGKP
jgi:hypothetical protein